MKFLGQEIKPEVRTVYGEPPSRRYWIYEKRPAQPIMFDVMGYRYLELNEAFKRIILEEEVPLVYKKLRSKELTRYGFTEPLLFSSSDRTEAGHSGIGVVFTGKLYPSVYPVQFDDAERYPIIPDVLELFRATRVLVSQLQERIIEAGGFFETVSPVTPGSIRMLNDSNGRKIVDDGEVTVNQEKLVDNSRIENADSELEGLILEESNS